jgi:hypothetical protein
MAADFMASTARLWGIFIKRTTNTIGGESKATRLLPVWRLF